MFMGDRARYSFPSDLFYGSDLVTIYYPMSVAGWTPTAFGRPTVLWNPAVRSDCVIGMQAGNLPSR